MQIQKTTVFNFSFQSGGITYNFSIAAISQEEAIEKLSDALTEVVSELKSELAHAEDERIRKEQVRH